MIHGGGLTIRATEECRAWLDEAVEHCRTDMSKLLGVTIVDYVQVRGFTKPAPKR